MESRPGHREDAEHPGPHAGALEDEAGEREDDRGADVRAHQPAPLLGALAQHPRVQARAEPDAMGPAAWRRGRAPPRRVRPLGAAARAEAGERADDGADREDQQVAPGHGERELRLPSSWPWPRCPADPGPSSSQMRMKPGAVGSGSRRGRRRPGPGRRRSAGGPRASCRSRSRRGRAGGAARGPGPAPLRLTGPGRRRCHPDRSGRRARCRSRVRPCSGLRGPVDRPHPRCPTSLVARAVVSGGRVVVASSRSPSRFPCTASAAAADGVLHHEGRTCPGWVARRPG